MRNTLLILMPVLALFIVVAGWGGVVPPAGFPTTDQLDMLLQQKRPAEIHEALTGFLHTPTLSGDALRALLNALDEIERRPDTQRRREAVETYRAWLLAIHGYDTAALTIVHRLANDPVPLPTVLQADLALLEATIEQRAGNASAAAAAVARLSGIDVGAAQALQERLTSLTPAPVNRPGSTWLLAAVLWLALLLTPALVMERERRLWLARFPSGHDRTAPYNALRRSPLSVLLATAGGMLVLTLGLPRRLGIGHDLACAILHWLLSYTLALIPVHKLDREVRNALWTLDGFLSAVFRLHLLRALPLAAPLVAFLILRRMAAALPWWGIHAPWAPALAFAALCAAVLLLIPLVLPFLLGMRRIPVETLPRRIRDLPVTFYRWNLFGSGIANAVSFGYLESTHAIAFTGDLLDQSPADDLVAVATHEEAHLVREHLFLYFLAMVNLALLAGCWAALYPAAAGRLLIFGPTVMEGVLLVILWMLANRMFSSMGRRFEFEADAFAAERIGREAYIGVLTRLTRANFMPVRIREGDEAPGIHPSLAERRRALRARDGSVFEPHGPPPAEMILSLWRSRLALEWSRGETEAIHLCALDDDPPDDVPAMPRLQAIARRQAAFGAECLIPSDGAGLEILECAQKAIVKTAEPPIPVDRVCALCSGGMREALAPEPHTWSGTTTGCRLCKGI
ncbi:MAG TPA: M48 family metalloprotease [Candidatus Ozemobacteraceae bacterium]